MIPLFNAVDFMIWFLQYKLNSRTKIKNTLVQQGILIVLSNKPHSYHIQVTVSNYLHNLKTIPSVHHNIVLEINSVCTVL